MCLHVHQPGLAHRLRGLPRLRPSHIRGPCHVDRCPQQSTCLQYKIASFERHFASDARVGQLDVVRPITVQYLCVHRIGRFHREHCRGYSAHLRPIFQAHFRQQRFGGCVQRRAVGGSCIQPRVPASRGLRCDDVALEWERDPPIRCCALCVRLGEIGKQQNQANLTATGGKEHCAAFAFRPVTTVRRQLDGCIHWVGPGKGAVLAHRIKDRAMRCGRRLGNRSPAWRTGARHDHERNNQDSRNHSRRDTSNDALACQCPSLSGHSTPPLLLDRLA
jgi:hypothetical protein